MELTGVAKARPSEERAMLNEMLAAIGNKNAIRKQAALKVKEAFDGVDWNSHSWNVNGVPICAGEETAFYKKSEIDKAIKRLNEVLGELGG